MDALTIAMLATAPDVRYADIAIVNDILLSVIFGTVRNVLERDLPSNHRPSFAVSWSSCAFLWKHHEAVLCRVVPVCDASRDRQPQQPTSWAAYGLPIELAKYSPGIEKSHLAENECAEN